MDKIIVVVEDDNPLLEILLDAIEFDLGHMCRTVGFSDRETAQNFCLENRATIPIIFADGNLGQGGTGWELARSLRQEGWKGFIIYIGHSDLEAEHRGLFSGRCEKDPEQIVGLIRKILD